MEYKISIGLRKATETVLVTSIAVVTMIGVADVDLWALADQYLRPYLSGLTVAGLLTMFANYIKIKGK